MKEPIASFIALTKRREGCIASHTAQRHRETDTCERTPNGFA